MPDLSPAPALRRQRGSWRQPARRLQCLIGPKEFSFLNVKGTLDEIGWNGAERSKLWRYNQHYFDDLNAVESELRVGWHRDLLNDWIGNNPPCTGNGWEPYPVSLRIVNWVKWVLAGNSLPSECESSLAIQARWLIVRLEKHLLGNHLFANAKALVFVGMFFKGAEADRWLSKGLHILNIELAEQILNDGGHFERSPMYHHIILEDVLDLINLINAYSKKDSFEELDKLNDSVCQMLSYMKAMGHPDGELAFFNDSTFGVAATRDELIKYASRLGISGDGENRLNQVLLKDSGFFRWEQGVAVLIANVGKVGPDYIPGHAHADTLSFELSLTQQRVLVNSGVSLYEDTEERLRQRGTRAHNTVEIDGANSSEVWKSFRVARRAKTFDFSIQKQNEKWVKIASSHDGYKRLKGRNIHRREWVLKRDSLIVRDEVSGSFRSAVARFHLHPDVRLDECSGERCIVSISQTGQKVEFIVEGGRLRVQPSTWHPQFGTSVPNNCLAVQFHGSVRMIIRWKGTD